MKKNIVSLLLLVGFAAHAQITLHPKGGLVLSNIAFDENEGQKMNMGVVAGLGINIPLIEDGIFSIQPEILYMQKGFRSEFEETERFEGDGEDIPSGEVLYRFKVRSVLNYIELPILAKATFGGDNLKFFVNAGPYVGYWLSGKSKSELTVSFNGQTDTETETRNAEFNDQTNRLDYGFHAGGGMGLQLGPGMVTLEGRYGYGLSNIAKDPSGQASRADLKSQHRTIMVMVGYTIPLGGN